MLMASQTLNGIWGSDFWEHSAVIRELATNPWGPRHPQLLMDSPHAFFSPYLLGVGLFERMTGLTPIQVLSVAAMLNLALLLVGLWLFLTALPAENLPATAFYSLLFTLFLLGPEPPRTSGFFHLSTLGWGLPYPATFAAALSLIGFYGYRRYLDTTLLGWFAAVVLIAAIVILTHPLSFIFLSCSLFALSWSVPRPTWQGFGKLGLLFALTLGLAALWPYYPFVRLLLGESRVYDAVNYGIYLQRVSLAISLLGLPFLFLRLKRNWRDPLVTLFALLSVVYVLGYLTQHWSYGRVVAGIVLVLHVALASAAAAVEARLVLGRFPRVSRWLFTGMVLVLCVIFSYRTGLTPALQAAWPGQRPAFAAYTFLSEHTRQYDVVLADLRTSWFIPTFGGKVVAARHPLAFVPDQQARVADLEFFFGRETDDASRKEIAQRYGADYLLLNKRNIGYWSEIATFFLPTSRLVYEDDNFLLIALNGSK
jgi:hypothetical protein